MLDWDRIKKKASELYDEATKKIKQYTPESFSKEKKLVNAIVISLALMTLADKKIETEEVTKSMELIKDIEEILEFAKQNFEKEIINPIMSSTGVIGVYLNKDKLKNGIKKFQLEKDNNKVSRAIMTTDSYPKEIAFEVILNNGDKFRIGAIAKGAGMINPAMATMLCFVVTDANITYEMETILKEVVDETFNAISVDGDTSTNDSVFLLSNKI